jgi:putative hemolysin
MRSPPAAGERRSTIRARQTLRETPPLIKGYWRLGAESSRDAVDDRPFGATD